MSALISLPNILTLHLTASHAGTRRASRYAQIRSELRVAPADAIHLASASEAGADLFLTNDQRLKGKIVAGIQFIAGLDTNIL